MWKKINFVLWVLIVISKYKIVLKTWKIEMFFFWLNRIKFYKNQIWDMLDSLKFLKMIFLLNAKIFQSLNIFPTKISIFTSFTSWLKKTISRIFQPSQKNCRLFFFSRKSAAKKYQIARDSVGNFRNLNNAMNFTFFSTKI